MSLPDPSPRLLIRYGYLWSHEAAAGRLEGSKDGPVAIVLSVVRKRGERLIIVLPVLHSEPVDPTLGVEIPLGAKRRLGLDDDRSWIVLTEENRFVWPELDVRPVGRSGSFAYGSLPFQLFEDVRTRVLALVRSRQTRAIGRAS